MASLIAPDRLAATGSIPGWTEGQLSHAAGALAFLWHPGRHALCRSPSGAAVLARCDGLIELREAVRRAKPRLAWVPWLSLLPRLATKAPASDDSGNGGNGGGHPGSASASPPSPPTSARRGTAAPVGGGARNGQGFPCGRCQGRRGGGEDEGVRGGRTMRASAPRGRTSRADARAAPPLPLPTATRGRRRVGRAARRAKHACERHTHTRSGRCVPQTRACNGRGAAAVPAAARRRRRRRDWRRRWTVGDAAAHHRVLGAHDGAQLSSALVENAAQIELVQSEAVGQSSVGEGAPR